MLGHLLHNERAQSEAGSAGDSAALREQKKKLERGRDKARRDQFGDLGVY